MEIITTLIEFVALTIILLAFAFGIAILIDMLTERW